MKSNYIVKNGNRETGEMSVFEAVEVMNNFKALSDENDRIEIHSFCRKWAIKQGGRINRHLVFKSQKEADEKWWEVKPNFFENEVSVVEVREFFLWFRKHDDKDFIEFYTDTANLEDAVDEAINETNIALMAIEYDGEVVARYGENFIKNPAFLGEIKL